jgi:predicted lipoprotein with Yx(FWY)xxD motif
VASSQFGPVLFDGSGQAIYLFDAETTSKPNCYGDCASAWPPVLTNGRPVAQGGVQGELLGVTTRRDGSTQVTYAGKPLYFYAHEGKDVVLCHNVREFGGLWLAITRSGSPAPT